MEVPFKGKLQAVECVDRPALAKLVGACWSKPARIGSVTNQDIYERFIRFKIKINKNKIIQNKFCIYYNYYNYESAPGITRQNKTNKNKKRIKSKEISRLPLQAQPMLMFPYYPNSVERKVRNTVIKLNSQLRRTIGYGVPYEEKTRNIWAKFFLGGSLSDLSSYAKQIKEKISSIVYAKAQLPTIREVNDDFDGGNDLLVVKKYLSKGILVHSSRETLIRASFTSIRKMFPDTREEIKLLLRYVDFFLSRFGWKEKDNNIAWLRDEPDLIPFIPGRLDFQAIFAKFMSIYRNNDKYNEYKYVFTTLRELKDELDEKISGQSSS